jgi:glycosyltransferase involved in cell wall biosynthesis
MKILLYTRFHPNVGGIETISEILAHELVMSGHHVTVATDVPRNGVSLSQFPFRIIHQPTPTQLLAETYKCDVLVLFNIRLKSFWAALPWRSKTIATHHGFYWIDRTGNRDWRERLKIRISQYLNNVTVSRAIARELGSPCRVIPAPYKRQQFQRTNFGARSRELAFLGRLVSDKGVDVALRALAKLETLGLKPRFTIMGDGPEREPLESLARELHLADRVCFTGIPSAEDLVSNLNDHEILLVPSLWQEPFGLVAVEGIACGCAVIASAGGGLPEAIGRCGLTFPNGDVDALAFQIRSLLTNRSQLENLRSHAAEHLAKHDPKCVAQEYIRLFEQVVRLRKTPTSVCL